MQLVFINYPLETFTPTQSGAIATIIWECCRCARDAGIEPWVITQSSEAPTFAWDKCIPLRYPPIPTSGSRIPYLFARIARKSTGWRHLNQGRFARSIARTIKERGLEKGTFVMLNDPETLIFLRQRFPQATLVHWFQNQLDSPEWVLKRFARSVDVVLACSRFTAEWVENYYHLPKDSTQVVYNAVDLRHFRPSADRPAEPPVIGFVGRTGIEKAPDLLLRSALQVAKSGRRFAVQILGSNHWDRFINDPYQRQLTSQVNELELLGIPVRRPGHIDRTSLPGEMSRAHIHVTPSRWDEPFGMTTVEGMACGLATVASATGGTPEVIGDAGLLFGRDSTEDLTECLIRLIDDAPLRQSLGAKGRDRAEQFSWQRTWDSLRAATLNMPCSEQSA